MRQRTGTAQLPLHGGSAPAWLFSRMVKLAREISIRIVSQRHRRPDLPTRAKRFGGRTGAAGGAVRSGVPQTDPVASNMPRFARFWLCAYLLGWVPLNYAAEASRTLPTIGPRGPAAAVELVAHGAIAALAAAAGWMLWSRNPAGPALPSAAVLGAAAASVQSLYWSVLPHDVPPGTALPLALAAAAHGLGWFFYLRRRERM